MAGDRAEEAFFSEPADKSKSPDDVRFEELTNLVLDLMMLNMHAAAAISVLARAPILDKTPGIEIIRGESAQMEKRIDAILRALKEKQGFNG